MSSGCGDTLSLADLQTAKKHQLFEAEVITGKAGGVSGGADIDYATNQVTGQRQKTLPAVLRDAGFRPAPFTFATGGVLGDNDADMAVLWPLSAGGDGAYYSWKGALPKVIPASSTPASTGGVGLGAWVSVGDVTLRGELASDSGAGIVGAIDSKGQESTVEKELDKTGFSTKDFLISAFFQDANNQGFKLFKTPDGANFTRINKNELISSDGTFPAGRDICLYYFDDKWYAALTGGTKDFLMYRSDDLVYWEKFECNAGPTTLRWQPGSVIGGTISQINPIWAPSITEVNGELYVELSIANKPLMTEITGNTVDYLSVFSCRCNNIENLTFDMPVLMLPDGVSHYDQDFTQAPDGSWVCTTANTYSHKLEIWTAASYFGPYALITSVQVAGIFTEGPSIVRLNSSNKWRVYVDAYQDNGTCYYVDSTDLTTWTTAIRAQIPWAVRHGTIRNLSNNANAAKAINSYSKAESLMMTDTLEPCWNFPQVTASATIVPRLNHVYRVGNNQVTLTIDEYGGDYFWVVNSTGSPGFGVTVKGAKIDGTQVIGYGQTNLMLYKFLYNKATGLYNIQGRPNDAGVLINFSTVTGWPTVTSAFKPRYGATYTAFATDSSNTTVASLPTDMPDGTYFHIMYSGGSGSSRNITLKANGAGIGVFENDVVLSGPNGNGDKLYTLKKVNGLWRLMA